MGGGGGGGYLYYLYGWVGWVGLGWVGLGLGWLGCVGLGWVGLGGVAWGGVGVGLERGRMRACFAPSSLKKALSLALDLRPLSSFLKNARWGPPPWPFCIRCFSSSMAYPRYYKVALPSQGWHSRPSRSDADFDYLNHSAASTASPSALAASASNRHSPDPPRGSKLYWSAEAS